MADAEPTGKRKALEPFGGFTTRAPTLCRLVTTRASPPPGQNSLGELDALLAEGVRLHCIGGFVITLFYGLPRPTEDIDYYSVLPSHCVNDLQELAGPGSRLAKKYKVHLQYVAVNVVPANY